MRNQTVYRILCEEKENENVIPIYIQLALGAFGNIFAVMLLLASRHKHRWQTICILFTGLVMIDLIHNCVCYPLVLKRYISNFTWCFSIPMCDFFSFMETCSHLASGMIIGLMTVDRYLYITRFRNQKCPRRRTYVAALFTVLIFASIIAGLQLIGLGNSQLYYPGSWCFLDFTDKAVGNRVNAAIYSAIGLCSLFGTVIIGVKTIYIIRRNPEYQALLLDNNLVTGVYDEHVTTFLVISMVTFLLLWSPLLVGIIIIHVSVKQTTKIMSICKDLFELCTASRIFISKYNLSIFNFQSLVFSMIYQYKTYNIVFMKNLYFKREHAFEKNHFHCARCKNAKITCKMSLWPSQLGNVLLNRHFL